MDALLPAEGEPVARAMDKLECGQLDPDEFYCLVLSILGCHRTRTHFPAIVRCLKGKEPALYMELMGLHTDYWNKQSTDIKVQSFDTDFELAIARSLQEQNNLAEKQSELSSVSKISFADVAKKSSRRNNTVFLSSSENTTFCNNERTLQMPPKTNSHQITREKTCIINSYCGQPEPEDCVTCLHSEEDIFHVKSPAPRQNKAKQSRRSRRKKNSTLARGQVSMRPVMVWFRRDLRLHDNPALVGALELGVPIIPVFLWSIKEESGENFTQATGGATKYWLHHALVQLNQSLVQKFGSHIVFRETHSCAKELLSLVQETGADTVIVNAVYEPWLNKRDDLISETLRSQEVKFTKCHSYCLHEPNSVNTEGVGLRGIGSVTHFMSCCKRNHPAPIGVPLDAPGCLPTPSSWPESADMERLNLAKMPHRKDGTVIDWAATIRKSWDFSEDGAYRCLVNFLEDGIKHYEKESGRTDKPYTSHISPYLHFGQISPRTVLQEAYFTKKNVPKFLRKLAWRDLAYWLLVLFPHMPSEPIRPAYKNQRWNNDKNHLKAWQKGLTGYPLVDAAMRELWLTGWMNNYARHVVASFLVAYLHIHWIHGYRWFQDTLVDADVAINAMMWQNGGMSGLDHWNFVMHPVDSALTCDPNGSYVRKWCPELAGLPDEYIHKPWKCAPSQLRRAGQDYPHRIVQDLEERREQSLKDVVEARQKHPEYLDKVSGCDMVPIPDQLLALTLGCTNGDDEVVKNQTGCFLLPVITRKEFKYKTLKPDAKDNPYNTVLKGYVSRKRDETIAYMNERHFTASTINEGAQRYDRIERTVRLMEDLPQPTDGQNKSRRTKRYDPFSVIPSSYLHLAN
ncbi:hypothetical protein GDO86_008379 [Hymenochirus boettgeri]|uniref:Photolyase/cryptochrome alpha/beta domain-containing protein n=1 Tax=Hymenochirus boettgeri TaxID=247094 RepID=A0A8T2IXA5_9PIPI|nr:hypothetical protein GDO86_008379 [Hymenochirus boettgeri]